MKPFIPLLSVKLYFKKEASFRPWRSQKEKMSQRQSTTYPIASSIPNPKHMRKYKRKKTHEGLFVFNFWLMVYIIFWNEMYTVVCKVLRLLDTKCMLIFSVVQIYIFIRYVFLKTAVLKKVTVFLYMLILNFFLDARFIPLLKNESICLINMEVWINNLFLFLLSFFIFFISIIYDQK